MKARKKGYVISFILTVTLLLCLLSGCGSKANDSAVLREDSVVENASGTYAGSNKGMGETSSDGGEAPKEQYEIKIVRTSDITAETKQFENALSEIETTVATLGGYVEASGIRGRNYGSNQSAGRMANYTLRIPAERLDEFLATAGALLNVTASSTTATDVSNQYYDTVARLNVLETERQVLEKMLSESQSVANMITVEERLYNVIYEIESYKTSLNLLESKIAYATVTLQLTEVADLTVTVNGNTFGSRMKRAVQESWQNFAEFCKDAAVWLVYALPALLVIGVIGIPILLLTIRAIKKRNGRYSKSRDGYGEE